MNKLAIRVGTDEDLPLLATLNKQLIEDEAHDNKMSIEQLQERMSVFIHTDYTAYIFHEHAETIGYALVNHHRQPFYLRQFFICRNCRKKGYGKQAFFKLLEQLNTTDLDIEVMYWNTTAYSFWQSLGFKERSVYMRRSD